MKKLSIVLFAIFIVAASMPFLAFAAPDSPIVPNCGADCNFADLLQLAVNLVNFLILFSIPLAAIAFAYAGFLYLSSAGDESKLKEGKKIFVKVLVGFLFILSAWLIVNTIMYFLNPCFSLLAPSNC